MDRKKLDAEWGGLWKCGCYYISKNIFRKNLEELIANKKNKNIRVLVRKNKFKGSSDIRPSFQFTFIGGLEGTELKHDQLTFPVSSYHEKEKVSAITLSDAVYIARECLHDLQYGYSIDDLVVEVESFMREKSFDAYDSEDID